MTIRDALEKMTLVNDYWLRTEPEKGQPSWSEACYFLGCLKAYEITEKREYMDVVVKWCKKNEFKTGHYHEYDYAERRLVTFFTEEALLPWQYENAGNYIYLHADNVMCGRVYYKLWELMPDSVNMDILMETLDFNIQDSHKDYWWWCDALHMALCLYHQIAIWKKDERYAKKAHALFMNAKEKHMLYDEEEHLWFRDYRFHSPSHYTKNGKKTFWGRGNGWVYAALIQTLEVIGEQSLYSTVYKKMFLEMTEALLKCRNAEGLWGTSLYDNEEYPTSEGSSTLLILHSMILAVRLGVLDASYAEMFEELFEKFTDYAVTEEGFVGYIQGVAKSPGETRKDCTKDYAVGYYLMCCAEWIKYCEEKNKSK